ncbi:hypothetical protein [Sphingobium sp. CAP-1]|uniref:hypothetical protein n=1 Tax=Sphingobium sp. CAP-1 TaxID=2676077 RepID=UPI0012BB450A|nr:hypothetical protein [Sphingobium sp. CAP-1]QGP78517.1 hypothetical protein GL174_05605 [Sphingobium sp. CAP-1]
MPTGDNLPSLTDARGLGLFEIPEWLVRPSVRACRLFNTMLDGIFYDVPRLNAELIDKGSESTSLGERVRTRLTSFDALSDPEGSLLLIDAATAPYVHKYRDVGAFLASPYPEAQQVEIATITGVGSSALGSAALAWDISVALEKPVLAIVPGYGVADVMLQSLGGWFGFGLYDWLQTKSLVQNNLANVAPNTARIGRELAASTPDAKTLHGGPVFRHGSGSSDVLHAIMRYRDLPLKTLIGHSKGALQIGNAIQSLPRERVEGLTVVTLGCPIAENVTGVAFHQYLGLFDALGQLNMWGNQPDEWVSSWHTTNPMLPPAMHAGPLTQAALAKRAVSPPAGAPLHS